jgi:hypothetical protein
MHRFVWIMVREADRLPRRAQLPIHKNIITCDCYLQRTWSPRGFFNFFIHLRRFVIIIILRNDVERRVVGEQNIIILRVCGGTYDMYRVLCTADYDIVTWRASTKETCRRRLCVFFRTHEHDIYDICVQKWGQARDVYIHRLRVVRRIRKSEYDDRSRNLEMMYAYVR